MDEVGVEIAAIKNALVAAAKKVDTLSELITVSDNLISKDDCSTADEMDNAELINRAETMLRWSRLKANMLNMGAGLFTDSCWNMCLDIYVCDLKDEKITVSSIAHSSGIPMTTAMRYINVMVEEGLLEKSPNPSDNRMIFISTSTFCKDKISLILQSLGSQKS
ncbi:helix-turn-helix domain-containing protein [Parasphingorhabdus cellanae]|uniref:Helix-turn-helix domain-containing protein n=1 Tax=Parasphingorhabdus cellanae TaxID=2806553 RepID=A0ABX7T4Q5_9SPHN|nr:helix-turn-helix domain-containing protein [Parasphingorhabdus cellanae]QTD55469.1 helix-turn-helix domain-containing protein [Parasphingorhabdus cellanae]